MSAANRHSLDSVRGIIADNVQGLDRPREDEGPKGKGNYPGKPDSSKRRAQADDIDPFEDD